MLYTYIDIELPESVLTVYESKISSQLVDGNRLRFHLKTGHYTPEKTSPSDSGGSLTGLSYGLSTTYVEKKKVAKGFEFNSGSGEKTLYSNYVFGCLSKLQKELDPTDTIKIYDYDTLEEEDIFTGVTIRYGKFIDLEWQSQSLLKLPIDYYSNPATVRESGDRLGVIRFVFRETSLRDG
jgi:hypothetical protein